MYCLFYFKFCGFVMCVFFLWMYFFNDKTAKIKEEFNILICSRLRIMNLHVSRIPNIRWKDKIFHFNTSKSQSSLPQLGCVRGANTFPNHNQFFTDEFLTRPVHPGFLVILNQILGGDSQRTKQQKQKSPTKVARVTFNRMTTPLEKVSFLTILD
jgi:3-hydroxymyristoyl/3-hydroxydecanoyl-(acyl carrier protein) dehydratase